MNPKDSGATVSSVSPPCSSRSATLAFHARILWGLEKKNTQGDQSSKFVLQSWLVCVCVCVVVCRGTGGETCLRVIASKSSVRADTGLVRDHPSGPSSLPSPLHSTFSLFLLIKPTVHSRQISTHHLQRVCLTRLTHTRYLQHNKQLQKWPLVGTQTWSMNPSQLWIRQRVKSDVSTYTNRALNVHCVF